MFCLFLILVLFLDWFPGMIGPHPIDSPVPGWMTLLLSPFVVLLVFSASQHIGFEEFLFAGVIVMIWSAPALSLLNLLLCVRRFNLVLWLYRILLTVSLGVFGVQAVVTVEDILLERSGDVLLGAWIYTGLLCILVVYEIIFYITIPKRGF